MGAVRRFLGSCWRVFHAGVSFRAALLPVLALLGGLAIAGEPAAVEATEDSAYEDPEKPVISYLLSDEENAKDFQERFGLSDEEMEKVLATTRKENKALAKLYAASEKIVEANEELSNAKLKEKIAAFGYNEKVKTAVAKTKSSIERLLPEDKRAGLDDWVNAQWQQEVQAFSADSGVYETSATRKGITFKVFATQYNGYTRFEVALPHRKLKFDGGYRVHIRYAKSRKSRCTNRRVWAPVKEVGPWNTYDNYWQSRRYRTMWKGLRRGLPEAQAAYFHNYNGGRDERGRIVRNPAGIDLTPAVARKIGLRYLENSWVCVHYPWVSR